MTEPSGAHYLDSMVAPDDRLVHRYPTDSVPAAVTSAPSESGLIASGAAAVGAEVDQERNGHICGVECVDIRLAFLRKLTAAESARDAAVRRAEELQRRVAELESELAAAKNSAATNKTFLDELHGHVAEACEMLGLNRAEHMCDSWTLRGRCAEMMKRVAEIEAREAPERAHARGQEEMRAAIGDALDVSPLGSLKLAQVPLVPYIPPGVAGETAGGAG